MNDLESRIRDAFRDHEGDAPVLDPTDARRTVVRTRRSEALNAAGAGIAAVVEAAWTFFAFSSAPPIGQEGYLAIHLVGIGVTSLSLLLTFVPGYARWWQIAIVVLVLVSAALAQSHRLVTRHPADWTGVVALMLVLAFAFALFRLQYRYAALGGILAIACYSAMRGLVQAPGTSRCSSLTSTSWPSRRLGPRLRSRSNGSLACCSCENAISIGKGSAATRSCATSFPLIGKGDLACRAHA